MTGAQLQRLQGWDLTPESLAKSPFSCDHLLSKPARSPGEPLSPTPVRSTVQNQTAAFTKPGITVSPVLV